MFQMMSLSSNRNSFVTIYSLLIGVIGLAVLGALTDFRVVSANLAPLAFFAFLSFMLKRTGVHVAPEVNQSLVGVVDVAALFIFGPTVGAWVPVVSGSFYLVLTALRHAPNNLRTLVVSPLFNAGANALMSLASGMLYLALGGGVPLREFNLNLLLPILAALSAWFALDNLLWAFWELLYRNAHEFKLLFQRTLNYTLLIELAPLPFAVLIAVAYERLGGLMGPVFWMLAIALIGTGIVVQRFADAEAHLQRRQRDLQTLNEFNQQIALAGLDENQALTKLIEFAPRLARADLWRVVLFRRARDAAELFAVTHGEMMGQPHTESPLTPAQKYLLEHPEPILKGALARDPLPFEFSETIDGRAPVAALFVPIKAGDQVIGCLTGLSLRSSLFPLNLRNLDAMCIGTGVAVQNARLFASERRRARQLAIVSEVSQQVARFLDLDVLLDQTVHQLRERFGYSYVHLFMADEEKRGLVFRASTHPDGAVWREQQPPILIGNGIVGWAAALGEAILVPDVLKDSRYIVGHPSLINTRSELAVPLAISNQVIGVLDVQSERVGAFDNDDLYTVKTLAAQIAVAIEDARLYAAQDEEKYYLNTLLQVAENLAATTTLDEALETVVRITPLLVGVERCAVFLYDETTRRYSFTKGYGFTKQQRSILDALEIYAGTASDLAFTHLIENRAPVLVVDPAEGELIGEEFRRSFGSGPVLLVPLLTRGQVVGALVVDQGRRLRAFSQHEIQIIMGIANQAVVALENARLNEFAEANRRLEYEIGLARQIQSSFLPETCPQIPGYEICAAWRVAREVGGDFYDFVELPGNRVGLICADVSDKGMAAALFMALTRTLIRAMAIGKPTPSEALERANDLILADARTDMFVTALYGVLDPHENRVYYANAGHNPPIWFRRDVNEASFLTTHGMALGIEPHITIPERAVTLHAGDVLLLYTDGVTDAMNTREEEFGATRLANLVAASAHKSASELIDEILRAMAQFTGDAEQFDDVTLVAVKRVA